jgi:hypothetical protein
LEVIYNQSGCGSGFRRTTSLIEAAVDKIGVEVSQIAVDVGTIKTRIGSFFEVVQSHERALRGANGDVGLTAKVAGASQAMADLTLALRGEKGEQGLIAEILTLKKWMAELKDERKWLTRLVMGIVLAEIGGLLFVLLK